MKIDAVTDTWPNTLKVDVIGDNAPENTYFLVCISLFSLEILTWSQCQYNIWNIGNQENCIDDTKCDQKLVECALHFGLL